MEKQKEYPPEFQEFVDDPKLNRLVGEIPATAFLTLANRRDLKHCLQFLQLLKTKKQDSLEYFQSNRSVMDQEINEVKWKLSDGKIKQCIHIMADRFGSLFLADELPTLPKGSVAPTIIKNDARRDFGVLLRKEAGEKKGPVEQEQTIDGLKEETEIAVRRPIRVKIRGVAMDLTDLLHRCYQHPGVDKDKLIALEERIRTLEKTDPGAKIKLSLKKHILALVSDASKKDDLKNEILGTLKKKLRSERKKYGKRKAA